MEIYRGYIIMAVGAGIILLSIIGFIVVSSLYHRKKNNLTK